MTRPAFTRQRLVWTLVLIAASIALMLFLRAGALRVPRGEPVSAAEPEGDPPSPRIQPGALVYRGAFRLPDGPEEYAWGWSGQGLAYRPDGDADGADDGYPGSLFGVGHDWRQWVSEVSIPEPVVSKTKKLAELNTARTLQPFADIRNDLYDDLEQARAGLAYLPAQGRQDSGKLYFCWGPHMHEAQAVPSHGWCETDLSKPRTAGLWKVDRLWTYLTVDYMFPIPEAWAKDHARSMRLATGRFRDGGQGSMGPALFAIAPWRSGNPPKPGAELPAVTLLRYSSAYDERQHTLRDYHHSDEWSGGAWLTAGDRSAVAFVGTKGRGKCWYGFANGVVWPDEPPYPEVPPAPNDQRGWWSGEFEGLMLFYDTSDLAAVAAGEMEPWRPQPFATMEVDDVLYGIKSTQQLRHVGACAFDPARRMLYVIEFRGDGDKSLVHVWHVR